MSKRVLEYGLSRVWASLGIAVCCASACKASEDSEETKAATEDQAASISTGPVVDDKIAKAVANAAKAGSAAAVGSDQGPPENGILGPTRADAEAARGSAPSVKLGSSGSDPKIQLGSSLVPAAVFDKKTGLIDVSVRTGASMMPGTRLNLEFAQSSAAPASTDGASPTRPVVVSVSLSDLSASQAAQVIPGELAVEIRKLKGTELVFQTQNAAFVGEPAVTLSKAANPQLDTLVQAAGSGLSDAVLAFPKEPVGAGAFWKVTSRERLLGTDVLTYRLVKVVDVTDGQARLEVNTKRYLADGGIGLPGIESAKVHQFQAEGTGQLVVAANQSLPLEGRSQTSIRSFAEIEGQPRPVQVELRTEFAFK